MICRQIVSISLLFALLVSDLCGQSPYRSEIYEPDTYQGFRQNWSAVQDSAGILFFGNSTGLLRFDGAEWYPIKHASKGSAVLSFARLQNQVHWGGNGDLGIVRSDSLNQFIPFSYRSRIDSSHHNFSYLWQTVEHRGDIYYRNSNGIYVVRSDSVQVLFPDERFIGLFKLSDHLLVQKGNRELFFIDGDRLVQTPDSNYFENDTIFEVLPVRDHYLFFSRENGIVRFKLESFQPLETDGSEYIKQNRVYRGAHINDSEIALATLDGGVVIINHEGEIKQIIREEDGLPTNTVYNVYVDREETLWVTTDYGIAKILVNNPVNVWNEISDLKGSPLFVVLYKGDLFTGTTEGLFQVDGSDEMIQNEAINGRVYSGMIIDESLVLTTTSGMYRLSNEQVEQISEQVYQHLIGDESESDLFLGIYDQRIDLLYTRNSQFISEEFLELESVIEHAHVDGQRVWVLTTDNWVHLYTLEGSLISRYQIPVSEESRLNRIERLAGRIRLATDEGLFLFDDLKDTFIPDSTFNDTEIMSEEVFRFEQCSENEIWFRNHRKIKRAIREDGVWRTIVDPYRTIANDIDEGVEDIHCDEDGSVWFGASRNLYHLTDPDWTYNHNFNTNITGVLIHNDSLIYGGYGDPSEIKELKFEENELRFTYAAASYIEPEANEYRTRLRGYEDDWSNWSGEPQKDYTFIPEGTYTFEVQGRNVYHKTGSIDSYTFIVLPPWYRTIWAYLGYLILLGGIVYAGHRIRINSILKEQRIRDGIARDLHDELSSTLSSISFFANAIDSPKLNEKEGNRFLSLIKKSSLEAKEKISDIVWVIQSENDDWDNLLMRCKRFSADILDAGDVKHSFEIKGTFTGKPSLTHKKNIWLIFREILTNIARHAEPSQVNIRFSLNDHQLHIRIEDDGKGFDPGHTREEGYGLQNIKNRAKQLKADCTLESMPGEGTRWMIEVSIG